MKNTFVTLTVTTALLALPALAQDASTSAEEELAKKLANPVASLISVPIQANYDENMGPNEEGSVWRINIQPVIPFSLNEDMNVITRTIVPVIDQDDVPVKGKSESGLGDIVQSFFFSPKEPVGGWVLGAGPVFLWPTATEDELGAEKWGGGPTAVALRQTGPWTVGGLANHIETYAGDDNRSHVSATFVQPFMSYVTKTKTTLNVTTESTYDWRTEEWSVPLMFNVYQMLKVGPQIMQFGGGVRYWADSPENGPDDWGARIQLTFLFPK